MGSHHAAKAAPEDLRPHPAGGFITPWGRFAAVVLATGAALATDPRTAGLPWQRSAGSRVDLVGPEVPDGCPVLCGTSWLCPAPGGNGWLLGATQIPLAGHDRPPDPHPSPDEVAAALWLALAGQPLPATWRVGSAHHGIRLATPSRRPIAGPVPGHPGLFLFAGLGGRGVLHSPWVADCLADQLAGC